MTRALLVAAALGLSLAGANACEFQRSASTKVDQTKVASTTHSMSKPMSTAPTVTQADQKKNTTATVEKDG
ncbi:hypothetical protein [Mesorhizobium sp. 1B3]|uniref:hypothetical protein n=1 Tax=Mesorhizobium sp. 1B3 TaxID=3243599 RepID=UPI003D981087